MQPSTGPDLTDMTASIAEHVARVANARLDEADMEAIRRLFLDNFVVSLWGSTQPWTREVVDWSRRFGGTGESPVLGADWSADASVAALVHGTAAHSYELDDTHNETLSHPGAAIIPAALALAASMRASQADLFRAVAAGYEAMALIGAAAGGMETVHRGFHPTAVFGAFGAATACLCLHAGRQGKVVTREMLLPVWGHALSQASGAMQFSVEPTGGEVKRLHAGLAARNGVLAAEFGLMTFLTAPHRAVDGRYGAVALFGGEPRQPAPSARLQIHRISLKPYACCRLFHSTIDALAELTQGFRAPLAQVHEIIVSGPALIAEQHMLARPASTMAAQYSCPYIVGATLAYGPYRYAAYGEDFLEDPAIRVIAEKVRFQLSEELTAHYPDRFATGVSIRFTDGRVRSAVVLNSLGTPDKPLTREQIIAKGEGLAPVAGEPAGKALALLIWDDRRGAVELAQALAAVAL